MKHRVLYKFLCPDPLSSNFNFLDWKPFLDTIVPEFSMSSHASVSVKVNNSKYYELLKYFQF